MSAKRTIVITEVELDIIADGLRAREDECRYMSERGYEFGVTVKQRNKLSWMRFNALTLRGNLWKRLRGEPEEQWPVKP